MIGWYYGGKKIYIYMYSVYYQQSGLMMTQSRLVPWIHAVDPTICLNQHKSTFAEGRLGYKVFRLRYCFWSWLTRAAPSMLEPIHVHVLHSEIGPLLTTVVKSSNLNDCY